jgi:hypothetical protein
MSPRAQDDQRLLRLLKQESGGITATARSPWTRRSHARMSHSPKSIHLFNK